MNDHRPQTTPPDPESPRQPVLFYDGTCGFCSRSVQWLLRHDHRGVLRFAPLQGATYAALDAPHKPTDLDTMVLADADGVHLRSDGSLRALKHVGGVWRMIGLIGLGIPRPLRDAVYMSIARRRHAIAGSADTCPLPTPQQRARFLP
ncbi:MAG: hypothetical protein GIKADHBN_03132 [Phycisphaerales bacterium]|nr:hypothetical protein [Phycisphaerales bacterium]